MAERKFPETPDEVCTCIRPEYRRGLNGNGWGETRCGQCHRHIWWGVGKEPLKPMKENKSAE